MIKRLIDFVKKFIKEVFDKEDFPLQDKNGMYPIKYSHNHELRCPNCGHTSWTILDYTVIKCSVCFNMYDNYGILGLKIKNHKDETEKFLIVSDHYGHEHSIIQFSKR